MEHLPNILPVENLHTSNLPAVNVKYQHPIFRHQAHIAVTGSEVAFGLGLRVKSRAEVIPAAATVENLQSRYLCSQFGFALLFEKLPKLGGKARERVGEAESFVGLCVHGMF